MRDRGARCLRYCVAGLAACGALLATGCSQAETAPREVAESADNRPVVLFLGTSLTAGYGLSSEQAFPALLQERMDAAGFAYRAVNAGVSGDTSAGGLRRLEWLLRLPVAVLVLELGANDMLRGQDAATLAANLRGIVDRARAAHPGVRLVVAGMRAPPNLGPRYVEAFEAVYSNLARATDGALIPFLLRGVAGDPALNQADAIHPTAEGQQMLAATVWETLAPVLAEGEPSDSPPTGAPAGATH